MLESLSKTRPARTLPQIDHYLYKYASRRVRNTPWPLTHSTMTQHGTPRAPLLVMGRKRLPPCSADRRSEIAVRSFFSLPSSCSLSPPTCRSHRSSLPSREVHISRPSTCARPSPLRVNFYHSIFVPQIEEWRTDVGLVSLERRRLSPARLKSTTTQRRFDASASSRAILFVCERVSRNCDTSATCQELREDRPRRRNEIQNLPIIRFVLSLSL